MSPLKAHTPAQPFGAHDYTIIYEPQDAFTQVNISGCAALPLQAGARLTISKPDRLYDLIVDNVTSGTGGQWMACCLVSDVLWL